MARFNYITNSFQQGEVTPRFRGRTETKEHANSCQEIRNMIVYPQGGATRRPGTETLLGKIGDIDLTGVKKLIPLLFLRQALWMLEVVRLLYLLRIAEETTDALCHCQTRAA